MKVFEIGYGAVGVLLVASVALTGTYGLEKVDREIYDTAIELEEQMQENGFDMADAASTPEEEQEKRDMREAIAGALKTVPEGMRSVFLLRDVHGLSEAETAKALGLTKGTVKSRLARARGKMADCLRAQGITGGEGRAV